MTTVALGVSGDLDTPVTWSRLIAQSYTTAGIQLAFVLLRGGRVVATTVPGVVSIPRAGDFDAGGRLQGVARAFEQSDDLLAMVRPSGRG